MVRVMTLTVAFAWTLAGCAARPRDPITPETQEWTSPTGVQGVQMLTDHFDLRVTARDPVLREYLPTFMEGAYAAYECTVPQAQPQPERLIIYLFDTRDQWARFTRGFSPANAETYLHILSGGYTDYPSATAVAFDLRRDRTLSLLAHEGMHQYFARNFPEPVPAWVNEGLATQFESFELNGPHPNFTPRRNYSRKNHLRELISERDELIPLADLLRMDAGQAVRGVQYGSRAYYAQIWSLVLFLKEGPAPIGYRQSFANLLADVGTDRMTTAIRAQRVATPDSDAMSDGEMVFRHYISEDLPRVEADYREFAEALLR
jgi:hypothetical protein